MLLLKQFLWWYDNLPSQFSRLLIVLSPYAADGFTYPSWLLWLKNLTGDFKYLTNCLWSLLRLCVNETNRWSGWLTIFKHLKHLIENGMTWHLSFWKVLFLILPSYFFWYIPNCSSHLVNSFPSRFFSHLLPRTLSHLNETWNRGSHLQMFFEIGIIINFANLTRKHFSRSLFFIKLQALQAKFIKSTFFTKHLQWLLLMESLFLSTFALFRQLGNTIAN